MTPPTPGPLTQRGAGFYASGSVVARMETRRHPDFDYYQRLFAAAPEIADAGSELLELLPPLTDKAAQAAHRLNAAIAKARGD